MSWSLLQETNRGIGNGINDIITIITYITLLNKDARMSGKG